MSILLPGLPAVVPGGTLIPEPPAHVLWGVPQQQMERTHSRDMCASYFMVFPLISPSFTTQCGSRSAQVFLSAAPTPSWFPSYTHVFNEYTSFEWTWATVMAIVYQAYYFALEPVAAVCPAFPAFSFGNLELMHLDIALNWIGDLPASNGGAGLNCDLICTSRTWPTKCAVLARVFVDHAIHRPWCC